MIGWLLWVFVAGAFAVGEVTLTTGFWLAPFALSAALAAGVDAVGIGEPVDFLVFVVGAIAGLMSLRPLVASRLIHAGPVLRTGGAALVGRHATVLEPIAGRAGAGTVRIGADVWSARAYDETAEIAAGTDVEVVEIRGATAIVIE